MTILFPPSGLSTMITGELYGLALGEIIPLLRSSFTCFSITSLFAGGALYVGDVTGGPVVTMVCFTTSVFPRSHMFIAKQSSFFCKTSCRAFRSGRSRCSSFGNEMAEMWFTSLRIRGFSNGISITFPSVPNVRILSGPLNETVINDRKSIPIIHSSVIFLIT